MEGGVLFYRWDHGATLPVDEVARLRSEKVRSLREIEDFAGGLDAWVRRTEPVQRIRVTPADFVYGSHIFVYYVAALNRPAVAPRLEIRIQRRDPSGEEVWDHFEFIDSWINRRAQSGGLLFSMHELGRGEHRLRFEFVDGARVAATGDLWIDYEPSGE